MKFDLTYKGQPVVSTIKKIVAYRESEKLPAIILWDDEPRSERQLLSYIRSNKHYVYLRFGVACNGNFLLEEIHEKLASRACLNRDQDLKVQEIVKIVQGSKYPFTFIITNCHRIEVDQISWLTGLMIEFDLKGKFIYLLHPDHFSKMITGNRGKDQRIKYFLKRIKSKYAIID